MALKQNITVSRASADAVGPRLFGNIRQVVSRCKSLIGLVAMIAIMGTVSPVFLTIENITNIMRQVSIIGTLAVGMTFVILTGGIDLSVGAVLALSGVLVATFADLGAGLALLAGCASGAAVGALSGITTHYFKMQSFIVTLSSMSIARGLAFIISKGRPIYFTQTGLFQAIAYGYVGAMPVLAVIWLVITASGAGVLEGSKFGRYVKAIGGNEEAAYLTGINVGLIKILAFSLSGLLSGVGGFLMTAYFGAGMPIAGQGFELDAIASVVIGGTSLSGGKGSVQGTMIGVLIIGTLNNIFNLLNVSSYVQMVAKGLLIVGAVFLSGRSSTRTAIVK